MNTFEDKITELALGLVSPTPEELEIASLKRELTLVRGLCDRRISRVKESHRLNMEFMAEQLQASEDSNESFYVNNALEEDALIFAMGEIELCHAKLSLLDKTPLSDWKLLAGVLISLGWSNKRVSCAVGKPTSLVSKLKSSKI